MQINRVLFTRPVMVLNSSLHLMKLKNGGNWLQNHPWWPNDLHG